MSAVADHFPREIAVARGAAASIHPKYRADIDGLRAVAIVPVVLFHAFPHSVRGGYIGVDIFFVISGFLISTIILENVASGRFSFVDFYVRRIRRIFPALLVVLLATFGFGWFVLLAPEYRMLAKHVLAGATFTSNLVLWSEVDYFDVSAESKPLLHLWSLAIEEQFYIFWPLILAVSWKRRIGLPLIIGAIALASFALNLHYMGRDPSADFYSPLSRFWELLVGAGLAYAQLFGGEGFRRITTRWGSLLSLVGFALIATALAVATESSVFPGTLALLPVLGAALLIGAGSRAWFNRTILANRLFVWIGLVSFPLYLWHWPLLSFLRILGSEYPARGPRVIAVVAAAALAVATYALVERPSRRIRAPLLAAATLFALVMALGLVGLVGFVDGGMPQRAAATPSIVNAGDLGHDPFHDLIREEFKPCTPAAIRDEARIRCAQSQAGPIDLAIVGDSHAESIYTGIAEALPRKNVAFYMHDSLPVIGNPVFKNIYRSVIESADIRTVLIAAYWNIRLKEVASTDRASALAATVAALEATGKRVYLVEDTPNFAFTPRFCKYASGPLREHRCTDDVALNLTERSDTAAIFAAVRAARPETGLIETFRDFCDDKSCSMGGDGVLLYRDPNHLGIGGSRYLGLRVVARYPVLAGE